MRKIIYYSINMAEAAKKLTRSTSDKIIAGVCSGLAKYFDIDVNIVRAIFAIGTVLGAGSFALIYVALWVVLPDETGKSMIN